MDMIRDFLVKRVDTIVDCSFVSSSRFVFCLRTLFAARVLS